MTTPTKSLSERILDAFICRLSEVKQANGFRTDAGIRVFYARRTISIDDLPCFVVWRSRTDMTNAEGAHDSMLGLMTITASFHTQADQAATGRSLESGLADAKKAVLLRDAIKDDDGTVVAGLFTYIGDQSGDRHDGDQSESTELTFQIPYQEGYGDPYAAR